MRRLLLIVGLSTATLGGSAVLASCDCPSGAVMCQIPVDDFGPKRDPSSPYWAPTTSRVPFVPCEDPSRNGCSGPW